MRARIEHEQPSFQVRLGERIDASRQSWEDAARILLEPAWRSIRQLIGLEPTHHASVVHDGKIADNRAMDRTALIAIPVKIAEWSPG